MRFREGGRDGTYTKCGREGGQLRQHLTNANQGFPKMMPLSSSGNITNQPRLGVINRQFSLFWSLEVQRQIWEYLMILLPRMKVIGSIWPRLHTGTLFNLCYLLQRSTPNIVTLKARALTHVFRDTARSLTSGCNLTKDCVLHNEDFFPTPNQKEYKKSTWPRGAENYWKLLKNKNHKKS